jgi:hypothetical protein
MMVCILVLDMGEVLIWEDRRPLWRGYGDVERRAEDEFVV